MFKHILIQNFKCKSDLMLEHCKHKQKWTSPRQNQGQKCGSTSVFKENEGPRHKEILTWSKLSAGSVRKNLHSNVCLL